MKKFNLCQSCWKSKSWESFYLKRKKPQARCKKCVAEKIETVESLFNKDQMGKKVKDRLKFCNNCFELKSPLNFYKKGNSILSNGDYQRSYICIECDIEDQKNRKDPIEKRAYDNARWNLIKPKKKIYDQLYNKLPEVRLAKKDQYAKRQSLIDNQENYLPQGFWNKALDYYGRKCMRCGSKENLTYDHIIPVNIGRLCDWSFLNLQILCHSCNSNKRHLWMFDFRPMNKDILGYESSESIDIFQML